jgi:hypothetical protein
MPQTRMQVVQSATYTIEFFQDKKKGPSAAFEKTNLVTCQHTRHSPLTRLGRLSDC